MHVDKRTIRFIIIVWELLMAKIEKIKKNYKIQKGKINGQKQQRRRAAQNSLKNLESEEKFIYTLDTNILIDLVSYHDEEARERLRSTYSIGRFAAFELFYEIVMEEMEKGRNQRFFFQYSSYVSKEVLELHQNGEKYYQDSPLERRIRQQTVNAYLTFGFNPTNFTAQEKDAFNYIKNLFNGKVPYFKEFSEPLFPKSEQVDLKILAASAIANRKFLTLNYLHFIGDDGKVRDQIKERLFACNGYTKRKFGVEVANCEPVLLLEFIQEHFPEKYERYINTINEKCPGKDPFRTYPKHI